MAGIEVENLSQLQHQLRRVPDAVEDAAVEVIQDAGVRIRDRARENVRDRDVAPTIKKRRLAKGLDARVSVGHWRGKFEEFGTRGHSIRPKPTGDKQALAGDGFGPVVKVERHPGQDPHPFLQPAAEEQRREFPRRLARATNQAMRTVARR